MAAYEIYTFRMKKGESHEEKSPVYLHPQCSTIPAGRGLLRSLAGDWYEVFSAGTEPGAVHHTLSG